MSMLGGGMVPLFVMPPWMATASNASPVKWAVLAFEGALWRGFGLAEMALPCAILLAVGAPFALGARHVPRRSDLRPGAYPLECRIRHPRPSPRPDPHHPSEPPDNRRKPRNASPLSQEHRAEPVTTAFDYVLVGGGLQSALLALALRARRPAAPSPSSSAGVAWEGTTPGPSTRATCREARGPGSSRSSPIAGRPTTWLSRA